MESLNLQTIGNQSAIGQGSNLEGHGRDAGVIGHSQDSSKDFNSLFNLMRGAQSAAATSPGGLNEAGVVPAELMRLSLEGKVLPQTGEVAAMQLPLRHKAPSSNPLLSSSNTHEGVLNQGEISPALLLEMAQQSRGLKQEPSPVSIDALLGDKESKLLNQSTLGHSLTSADKLSGGFPGGTNSGATPFQMTTASTDLSMQMVNGGGDRALTEAGVVKTKMDVPLGDKQFVDNLNQRMTWLVKNGVQHAEIKLQPAHLGSIEVSIKLQDNQASVSFFSNQGAVREAIQDALPRLRDMLGAGGFSSVEAHVSHQQHSSQEYTERGNGSGYFGNGHDEGDEDEAGLSITAHGNRIVDFYA